MAERGSEAKMLAKVVATVQGADFRSRCAIALVKVAQSRYRTGEGLAAEIIRTPQRYVETVSLACASDKEVSTAISEANDEVRAFWPTDEMIEAVVSGLWDGLEGK